MIVPAYFQSAAKSPLLCFLLYFLLITPACSVPFHKQASHLGAVASESAICSKIGIELIQNGGNAADGVRVAPSTINCSTGL